MYLSVVVDKTGRLSSVFLQCPYRDIIAHYAINIYMNKETPPLGELIGEGGWRKVYQHGERDDWMVKVSKPHCRRSGQTAFERSRTECEVWELVRDIEEMRVWFVL